MLELEQCKYYCSRAANASRISAADNSNFCIKQNILFLHRVNVIKWQNQNKKPSITGLELKMSLNNLSMLFSLSQSLLQGYLNTHKKKRKTECSCLISVHLKILWKINWGWDHGKKEHPQISCVNYYQTASISELQQSITKSQGRYHSRGWDRSTNFITSERFSLSVAFFRSFYWEQYHQVTVRPRLAFLLLRTVTAPRKINL